MTKACKSRFLSLAWCACILYLLFALLSFLSSSFLPPPPFPLPSSTSFLLLLLLDLGICLVLIIKRRVCWNRPVWMIPTRTTQMEAITSVQTMTSWEKLTWNLQEVMMRCHPSHRDPLHPRLHPSVYHGNLKSGNGGYFFLPNSPQIYCSLEKFAKTNLSLQLMSFSIFLTWIPLWDCNNQIGYLCLFINWCSISHELKITMKWNEQFSPCHSHCDTSVPIKFLFNF